MLMGVGHNMVWKIVAGINWKLVPIPSKEDAAIIAVGYLYGYDSSWEE